MVKCLEHFSQESMLGKNNMNKIIKSIKDNLKGNFMSFFKEGNINAKNQIHSSDTYQ